MDKLLNRLLPVTLMALMLSLTDLAQAENSTQTLITEDDGKQPVFQCRTGAIPDCTGRCGNFYRTGSDWKVKSVEVYIMHNGKLIGYAPPIDMGMANMADFRSDLTNAQEEAIIDVAEGIDIDPFDNINMSLAEIYDEMVYNLSDVFPEVNRKPGQDSTILRHRMTCPVDGCTCVLEDNAETSPGNKIDRVMRFSRLVTVLGGSVTYHIIWTVHYKGYDRAFWPGACKYFF